MASTMAGVSLSAANLIAKSEPLKSHHQPMAMAMTMRKPWTGISFSPAAGGRRSAVVVRAAPDKLSEKVVESIKEAEQACAENPTSGECVAAWDEVEELSAAVSHAKDKKKATDPLEEYCKDNPEVEECRTYED